MVWIEMRAIRPDHAGNVESEFNTTRTWQASNQIQIELKIKCPFKPKTAKQRQNIEIEIGFFFSRENGGFK